MLKHKIFHAYHRETCLPGESPKELLNRPIPNMLEKLFTEISKDICDGDIVSIQEIKQETREDFYRAPAHIDFYSGCMVIYKNP